MKKFVPIAALAFLVISFASCKKDYTCTCTFTDSSGSLPSQTVTVSLGKQTKSNATSACNNQVTTVSGGSSMGWTCHL